MTRSALTCWLKPAATLCAVLAGGHSGWCVVRNNDATPRPGPRPTIPAFSEFESCDSRFPEDGKIISIGEL